jgi:NAD(P)-dependent dehydrogenase (short-subunit alcohol dehydrogenase family)
MNGKVVIVTGASSGLGLEASKQLLGLGLSHLIVAVRSLERGEVVARALRLAHPRSTIDVWPLNMNSYKSVQDFASRCKTLLVHIDAIILNSGLMPHTFSTVATGHEECIQVNYLSTMLLVLLMIPVLKSKTPPSGKTPHITVVSSVTAAMCKFPNRKANPLLPSFDDTKITPWDAQERYGVSKLLGQLFLVKLADHVNSDHVIINMVDPGLTKGTQLGHKGLPVVLKPVMSLFMGVAARPVEQGAATYIDAAVTKGKESHGCFLMNRSISQ